MAGGGTIFPDRPVSVGENNERNTALARLVDQLSGRVFSSPGFGRGQRYTGDDNHPENEENSTVRTQTIIGDSTKTVKIEIP